eukprot:352630-Chlamydomonas_euryale.AAC.11
MAANLANEASRMLRRGLQALPWPMRPRVRNVHTLHGWPTRPPVQSPPQCGCTLQGARCGSKNCESGVVTGVAPCRPEVCMHNHVRCDCTEGCGARSLHNHTPCRLLLGATTPHAAFCSARPQPMQPSARHDHTPCGFLLGATTPHAAFCSA